MYQEKNEQNAVWGVVNYLSDKEEYENKERKGNLTEEDRNKRKQQLARLFVQTLGTTLYKLVSEMIENDPDKKDIQELVGSIIITQRDIYHALLNGNTSEIVKQGADLSRDKGNVTSGDIYHAVLNSNTSDIVKQGADLSRDKGTKDTVLKDAAYHASTMNSERREELSKFSKLLLEAGENTVTRKPDAVRIIEDLIEKSEENTKRDPHNSPGPIDKVTLKVSDIFNVMTKYPSLNIDTKLDIVDQVLKREKFEKLLQEKQKQEEPAEPDR